MNKKILIGSIFVLTLLLLMPNFPAIHINAIRNEIKQGYGEISSLDILDFNLPDKFPLLFLLVLGIGNFRFIRGLLYQIYSVEYGEWGEINILYPFLVLRSIILMASANGWMFGWSIISEILKLDWELFFIGW